MIFTHVAFWSLSNSGTYISEVSLYSGSKTFWFTFYLNPSRRMRPIRVILNRFRWFTIRIFYAQVNGIVAGDGDLAMFLPQGFKGMPIGGGLKDAQQGTNTRKSYYIVKHVSLDHHPPFRSLDRLNVTRAATWPCPSSGVRVKEGNTNKRWYVRCPARNDTCKSPCIAPFFLPAILAWQNGRHAALFAFPCLLDEWAVCRGVRWKWSHQGLLAV